MPEMRAPLLAATGLLACIGLAGCDNATSPPPADRSSRAALQLPAAGGRGRPARTAARRRIAVTVMLPMRHPARTSSSYSSVKRPRRDQSELRGSNRPAERPSKCLGRRLRPQPFRRGSAVVSVPPDDRERRAPWRGYDEKCDDAR